MLLAMGKILYFNDCSKAVDYFSGIGFKNPELSNPSDYFMSIMSRESVENEMIETLSSVSMKHRNLFNIKVDSE